jgi:hypothetical protein
MIMNRQRLVSAVAISLVLTILSLTLVESDTGVICCVGITLFFVGYLVVHALTNQGKARVVLVLTIAAWLAVSASLITHYQVVRDHSRWLFLSWVYKPRVLAQWEATGQSFKHAEWDGWGFAGMDTTEFLVFDPTNSLASAVGVPAPVKAHGIPCDVYGVRRLERQWYAVLFYTETYWGQGSCP